MTWIKTIPMPQALEADGRLRDAYLAVMPMYPAEYARPNAIPEVAEDSIVASHSLIPEALEHAFATFGSLMAADLPLTRRQHEMIATLVSVKNRCFY
jgi:alkylhydroperoxidase family enzyme